MIDVAYVGRIMCRKWWQIYFIQIFLYSERCETRLNNKSVTFFYHADKANLSGSLGVAIREFPLSCHGYADYLLYVADKAAGIIEAKAEGATFPVSKPSRTSTPLKYAFSANGDENNSKI